MTVSPVYAAWRDSAWTVSVVEPIAAFLTVTATRSDAESVPAVTVKVNTNVVS